MHLHSRADFNSVIISFNGDVCKVSFTIYSLELCDNCLHLLAFNRKIIFKIYFISSFPSFTAAESSRYCSEFS